MKPNPETTYRAALLRKRYAEQACAHWDEEGFDVLYMHDCCIELDAAERALRAARKQRATAT